MASETRHDILLTDRTIIHLTNIIENCSQEDKLCQSFNNPLSYENAEYLKNNNYKYFIFITPSKDGNKYTNYITEEYKQSLFYDEIYDSGNTKLFKINL